MYPKGLWMAKIISSLLLTIAFLGVIHSTAFAMNFETYGNLYFEVADRNENENFKTTNPTLASDLWTYTTGDLFLRGSEDNSLLQFLLDYKFEGSLNDNFNSYAHTPAGYLNQYYVVVPLSDKTFLYCGQKYKHIGVAKLFSISNRYERAGYPTKLVEVDILNSDSFDYGFIANFKGASQWSQVQWSGFADYTHQNFNMQTYGFIEGTRGYSLVADLAYQAGKIQFYGEALWMSQADQRVANLNPSDPGGDSLDYRDRNSATKMLAGIMMNQNNYTITLEYMRNNEAYNPQERDDFIDYLSRHPGLHQYYTDYFSYNWARNYVGLSLYLPKLLGNDEWSLTSSFIASAPDGGNHSEYISYQAYLNASYNILQNLTANFAITHRFGGDKGEYLNLYEDTTRYQMSLFFSF